MVSQHSKLSVGVIIGCPAARHFTSYSRVGEAPMTLGSSTLVAVNVVAPDTQASHSDSLLLQVAALPSAKAAYLQPAFAYPYTISPLHTTRFALTARNEETDEVDSNMRSRQIAFTLLRCFQPVCAELQIAGELHTYMAEVACSAASAFRPCTEVAAAKIQQMILPSSI
jgi:hypothetical protein